MLPSASQPSTQAAQAVSELCLPNKTVPRCRDGPHLVGYCTPYMIDKGDMLDPGHEVEGHAVQQACVPRLGGHTNVQLVQVALALRSCYSAHDLPGLGKANLGHSLRTRRCREPGDGHKSGKGWHAQGEVAAQSDGGTQSRRPLPALQAAPSASTQAPRSHAAVHCYAPYAAVTQGSLSWLAQQLH
jgi:hypothetical protein